MPTQNPRLSITLKPEVAAVLRRVSELAEKSQSAFVAELPHGPDGHLLVAFVVIVEDVVGVSYNRFTNHLSLAGSYHARLLEAQ